MTAEGRHRGIPRACRIGAGQHFVCLLDDKDGLILVICQKPAFVSLRILEKAGGNTSEHKVAECRFKPVAFQNDHIVLADQLINADAVLLSEQACFNREFAPEDLHTVKNAGVCVSRLIAHSSLAGFQRIFQIKFDLIHPLVDLGEGHLCGTLRNKFTPIGTVFKYACFIIKRIQRFRKNRLAAFHKTVGTAVDLYNAVKPNLRIYIVRNFQDIQLDRQKFRITEAVKMETLRLHKFCENTPILFRIKCHDTQTLAALTAHLGKLRNKSCCGDGFTRTGLSRENAVHQLAFFKPVFKRCFISGRRRPALTGKHLPDIDVAFFHRRNCEFRHISDIGKHTALGNTGQVRICRKFIGQQNGRVTVRFHSAAESLLTVVRTKGIKVVDQMVLLFRRQVQYLQWADHCLGVCPGGFCKNRRRREALGRIGSDIHIRKECTVSAQSLHKAHILKIKQGQNILDLLINPLIALCIADCRTNTHTGR